MLNSISDNNLGLIKEALIENKYTDILIFDCAANLADFLELIADNISSKTNIYCLSENQPNTLIEKIDVQKNNLSNWSLKEYVTFFFGKSQTSFNTHQPIYEHDVPRLHLWRKKYLKEFWRKRTIGSISGQFRGHYINLEFDSSPEKDHYGESPLIANKIQFLENFIHQAENPPRRICCFITTGPRHKYIQAIIKNSQKEEFISIFSAGLFRTSAYKTVQGYGKFYKGTNSSVYGKPVYSDHCLNIGAGKRELWTMTICNGVEV